MSLLNIPDAYRLDPEVIWRPRQRQDRLRIPFGLTPDGEPVDLDIKESAQGGMGPHGLVIGATGSGKSEVLRTFVLGPGHDALPGRPQPRPRRLQGWCDVPRARQPAARLGRHHQPRGRADPGRPDAGRPVRRDEPAPGAAAPGRQLRIAARLRGRPGQGQAARPDADAVDRRRRVQRAAQRQAGVHRAVRDDRPAGSKPRRPPPAGLAAAGGGQAARARHAPVLPHRPADLLRR